jgi:osmotically inducible protein OsmC
MKTSFNLTEAGFPPEELETECQITFEDGAVTKSHLVLKAKVAGISESKFAELVKDAEKNCPVSKLLNTTISSEFTLN